jgi:phenylpyruvate tautomerase PptA (4-oxalocrotonate tautomerase family)
MSQHAAGSFEVKLAPIASHDPGAAIGRFSLDKQYAGDLVASASGEMLSVMGGVQGSAVYVAIERVSARHWQRRPGRTHEPARRRIVRAPPPWRHDARRAGTGGHDQP